MELVELSNEDLLNIIKEIPAIDLYRFCQVNKKLSTFCKDDYLWRIKLSIDFPNIVKPDSITYREFYQNVYGIKLVKERFNDLIERDHIFFQASGSLVNNRISILYPMRGINIDYLPFQLFRVLDGDYYLIPHVTVNQTLTANISPYRIIFNRNLPLPEGINKQEVERDTIGDYVIRVAYNDIDSNLNNLIANGYYFTFKHKFTKEEGDELIKLKIAKAS